MPAISLKLASTLAAVPALSSALPPLPQGRAFLRLGEHYLLCSNAYLVAGIAKP